MPLDTVTSSAYALLLGSVIALWLPWRGAWVVPFLVSIAFAYISGVLSGLAIVPLALLAVACWSLHRPPASCLLHFGATIAVILVALGLGAHAFPGFHPTVLFRDITFSPGATAYTLSVSFDKTAVGVLILGLCYGGVMTDAKAWAAVLRRAAPLIIVNIVAVVILALAIGYVRFDPKATPLFWPWAIVNLFFTCVAEEAFFRGFIQRQLDCAFSFRYKTVLVVAVSALLFGVAHAAGGARYVLLATIAGVGYALVFQRTQRIEASILAHFALNATHFIFLTYPRLA